MCLQVICQCPQVNAGFILYTRCRSTACLDLHLLHAPHARLLYTRMTAGAVIVSAGGYAPRDAISKPRGNSYSRSVMAIQTADDQTNGEAVGVDVLTDTHKPAGPNEQASWHVKCVLTGVQHHHVFNAPLTGAAACVCCSDLHMHAQERKPHVPPVILGHDDPTCQPLFVFTSAQHVGKAVFCVPRQCTLAADQQCCFVRHYSTHSTSVGIAKPWPGLRFTVHKHCICTHHVIRYVG